jgi:hypothetical protein
MMRREASTKTLVALTDQLLVAITNQLQVLQKATAETHDLQLMSVNYTLLIAILRTVSFYLKNPPMHLNLDISDFLQSSNGY